MFFNGTYFLGGVFVLQQPGACCGHPDFTGSHLAFIGHSGGHPAGLPVVVVFVVVPAGTVVAEGAAVVGAAGVTAPDRGSATF